MSTEHLTKLLEFFTDKGADLVVGIIGTVIGFLLGFALYFRQLSDAKLKEELDTQQRHVDQIRWLAGVFKQLASFATQVVEETEVFVGLIQREPSEVHVLPSVASFVVQRLMSPDNAPTFHAYHIIFSDQLDKEHIYRELISKSDFVAAHPSFTLEKFNYYRNSIYKRRLTLKAMIEDAANTLSTICFTMQPGGELSKYYQRELYNELNESLLSYNVELIQKSRPLKELVTRFVRPLQPTLVKKENRHIKGVNELIIKFKNINVAFTDLLFDSESFRTGFDQAQQKVAIEQLEAIRKRLEDKCDIAEAQIVAKRLQ